MTQASTDHGTVVPAGEAAIVTSGGMAEMELLVPPMDGPSKVPDLLLYLTACMVRGERDSAFFHEQIEWMEAQRHG